MYAAGAARAVAVRVGGGAAVARLSVGSSRSVSTLGDLVDLRADTTPYRNALQATHQRVRFDYNDVKTYVDAYAAGLHEAGYSGSKLAVWLGNDSENLILTFAAAKAGASLVVIDPARSADSIVDILGEERVRGLVFSARYAGANRLGDVESLFPELENYTWGDNIRSKRLRSLRHLIDIGAETSEGIQQLHTFPVYDPMPNPLPKIRSALSGGDTFITAYGAVGDKATTSTHKDLLDESAAAAKSLGLSEADTVACTAGIHTRSGLTAGPMAAMQAGAQSILVSREFSAEAAWKSIGKHQATVVTGDAAGMAALEASKPESGVSAGAGKNAAGDVLGAKVSFA